MGDKWNIVQIYIINCNCRSLMKRDSGKIDYEREVPKEKNDCHFRRFKGSFKMDRITENVQQWWVFKMWQAFKIISLLCCNHKANIQGFVLKHPEDLLIHPATRVSCFSRQQKQSKRLIFTKKKKKKERTQENWLLWALAIEKISRSLALCAVQVIFT